MKNKRELIVTIVVYLQNFADVLYSERAINKYNVSAYKLQNACVSNKIRI